MDFGIQDIPCGLENCESAFFEDMPMIVTSSPIEGKRDEGSSLLVINKPMPSVRDNPTWSELLDKFKSQTTVNESHTKNQIWQGGEQDSFLNSESDTSSSYHPIAEHKMKLLLTPGHKFQVISSGARKTPYRYQTPKKPTSYSKLNQQYWKKLEEESLKENQPVVDHAKCNQQKPKEMTAPLAKNKDVEISIQSIKNKLRDKNKLTTHDLEYYEQVLRKLITKTKNQEESSNRLALVEESELMKLIEKQIGCCNLSPKTKHILAKKNEEQEKRLIGLSVVKRKSASDIKKKINQQLVETKQQIKSREELEIKLVKAAQLKRQATITSSLFNQAHSARHKRVVTETRQKETMTVLQKQLRSEKMKNEAQINKIVKDVWKTFMDEQYNQLREEMREQQKSKIATVKDSEMKLHRLKAGYDEKLKELKEKAAAKAVEAGMEKKEISREIERIQRNMQHQFRMEFQTLLRNIETKGDHNRFQREERASRLQTKLKNADYVFDL